MKILKNVLKVLLVYIIGLIFVYALVIRVKQIDERDKKILQEKNNLETRYVYNNK